MNIFKSTTLLFLLVISLFFACNSDDEIMLLPNCNNQSTDTLMVEIASDINTNICLGENVLENTGTITNSSFCNAGIDVIIESVSENCLVLAPTENFVGTDEVCIIHCFDDGTCDTTIILVTVYPSYLNGVFVINEGPFQNGTGTVDFYHRGRDEVYRDIYQSANDNILLGNIAQSMTKQDFNGYVVVNNSNKVVVTNLRDFTAETSIEGFELPRYMKTSGTDKAYVSQWGADGINGSIKILDLTSNSITNTIEAGQGPERMEIQNSKLYVTQSGGFGKDSTVYVIDMDTDVVENTIEVGDNPNSIVTDGTGAIWVLGGGYFDWMEPANSTDGFLAKIENGVVVNTIPLSNGAQDLVSNFEGSKLYFSMDGKVYEQDVLSDTFDNTVFIDQSFYSLDIDPATGNIWGGDAGDFASDGTVSIFSPEGNLIRTFDCGIIPGNFTF